MSSRQYFRENPKCPREKVKMSRRASNVRGGGTPKCSGRPQISERINPECQGETSSVRRAHVQENLISRENPKAVRRLEVSVGDTQEWPRGDTQMSRKSPEMSGQNLKWQKRRHQMSQKEPQMSRRPHVAQRLEMSREP
jgi:hypothetical protein